MEKLLSNKLGILYLFALILSPFLAFLTTELIHKGIYLFLILGGFAVVAVNLYEKGFFKIPLYGFFLAFFLLYTILSDRFIVGKNLNFGYINNNLYLGSCLLVIIIESTIVSTKNYVKFIKANYVISILAFIFIIIQEFINPSFFVNSNYSLQLLGFSFSEIRLASIYGYMGGPILLGICFVPILGILIEESIVLDQKKRLFILFSIGAIVSFLSRSRFIMLNYILIFVLLPIHYGFKIKMIFRVFIIVIGMSLLTYYGSKAIDFDIDGIISERILERGSRDLQHSSAGTRLLAFKVFSDIFPENQIWGKGKFHDFSDSGYVDVELMRALAGRSSQLHVGYLSLFYYYGIIGGCIYLLFLAVLTSKLYKSSKLHGRWGGFVGWVMFLVSNLTLVYFPIFNIGAGMIILYSNYHDEKVGLNS